MPSKTADIEGEIVAALSLHGRLSLATLELHLPSLDGDRRWLAVALMRCEQAGLIVWPLCQDTCDNDGPHVPACVVEATR